MVFRRIVSGFFGGCGWFWIVLGGCWWLWIVVGGCINSITHIKRHIKMCTRKTFVYLAMLFPKIDSKEHTRCQFGNKSTCPQALVYKLLFDILQNHHQLMMNLKFSWNGKVSCALTVRGPVRPAAYADFEIHC